MLSNDEQQKLYEIFFPYAKKHEKELIEKEIKLAYYTTADTAKKILENGEIWLRQVSVMNDYSEIMYGFNQLKYLFDNGKKEKLLNTLYSCISKDTVAEIENFIEKFNHQGLPYLLNDTYIFCLTEHNDLENQIGRLSMWRTYGADDGISFIIDPNILLTNPTKIKQPMFLTPVAYLNIDDLSKEIDILIDSISHSRGIIQKTDSKTINKYIVNVLVYAVVSIKHIGFREEAEWRYIAFGNELSKTAKCNIENVRGIKQLVYKPSIYNNFKDTFKDILERIIIGPTPQPNLMNAKHSFFVHLLQENLEIPLSTAEKMVIDSDIPYRKI